MKSVLFQDTPQHCQLIVSSLQRHKLEEEKTILVIMVPLNREQRLMSYRCMNRRSLTIDVRIVKMHSVLIVRVFNFVARTDGENIPTKTFLSPMI